jgi:hypothetical protein
VVIEREVVNMAKFMVFLLLCVLVTPVSAATIYKWEDERGVVNFTDDFDNVPSAYRDQVEVKEYLTEGGSPLTTAEKPSPSAAPAPKEELRADIYGRDETWWRGRVRPWNELLKEATENHERVQKKFLAKAEELSTGTYWSRSQYQIVAVELDRLKTEMGKYETQMMEAKEQLDRLKKEAEESKADPNWLRY